MALFDIAREPASREGKFFYHVEDGYHYHRNRRDEYGTIYFKCVKYEKGCKGRAQFTPEGGFIHTQPHQGHGVDFLYPDEMAMRRAVLTRCRSPECVPFRVILDEEGLRYVEQFGQELKQLHLWTSHLQPLFHRFSAVVAERLTLPRMRTPMRNARLKQFPSPPPANLKALTDILLNPQYSVLTMTSDEKENLYMGL